MAKSPTSTKQASHTPSKALKPPIPKTNLLSMGLVCTCGMSPKPINPTASIRYFLHKCRDLGTVMRRAARDCLSMPMAPLMMAHFMKGITMGPAKSCGPMVISMKVIGNVVRWMDPGCSSTPQALSSKVSLRTTTLSMKMCWETHSSLKRSTQCSKNNENKSWNKRKNRKNLNTGFQQK